MQRLPAVDLVVLVVYLLAVVALGSAFARRSRTPRAFVVAGGAVPAWAVGLSLFGTFLSSNTFLGVPGKAFASNWNSFAFSLSLPLAAWIAARWFVPFYRRSGDISAYVHLERRFGAWARTYAVVCYLLTQLARVGSILFGVALALSALTGLSMAWVIVLTGALVTLYTLLGGIEAVIWTDVAQSIVLTLGALLVMVLLLVGMPEGWSQLFEIAGRADKFSLGSFGPDLTTSTFWVVLFYGLFINLNNFGIDQSYVQRYHTARSETAAARSVWLAALLYLPISLLFFLIGSALFAYYQAQPELLAELAAEVMQRGGGPAPSVVELGDQAFPHFIVHRLPAGVAGVLIAALVAAAMSSVDTSLNSSATVIESDLVGRYLIRDADQTTVLRVLRLGTVAMGLLGTGTALAMIGIESILDAWWTLSGVFAGGLLGLFLLGMLVRDAGRRAAAVAVGVGVAVILWLTLSPQLPQSSGLWRSPLHTNLTIVIGTSIIFFVGFVLTALVRRREAS